MIFRLEAVKKVYSGMKLRRNDRMSGLPWFNCFSFVERIKLLQNFITSASNYFPMNLDEKSRFQIFSLHDMIPIRKTLFSLQEYVFILHRYEVFRLQSRVLYGNIGISQRTLILCYMWILVLCLVLLHGKCVEIGNKILQYMWI